MSTLTKMSSKTSQQVVSPVVGAVLGFYYQPYIGFLVALAFGFQESPFKLKIKNKYFGFKVNWQLFLIYFVLGLACQVLSATSLFVGLAFGVGLRWYLSDGDLEKYGDYLEMGKEYLKKYTVVFNNFMTEKTEWVFKYLNQYQNKNNDVQETSPDNTNLDSFLSTKTATEVYQEKPSTSPSEVIASSLPMSETPMEPETPIESETPMSGEDTPEASTPTELTSSA
jgi:hypothetical protein